MNELLDLIGENDGDEAEFDTWVVAGRAAGLQPAIIQRLKRLGQVWTYINPETGKHMIVRGANPNKSA